MFGEREAKKLDVIPVSNNTVSCCIDAMSEQIPATIVDQVKKSEFYSLQIDKSRDVANLDNLMVYHVCCDPFEASLPVPQLSLLEQEQLIDLTTDGVLWLQFKPKPLVDFWAEAMAYPVLAKKALKVLMPFASSYLCEAGFSALVAVKTKYWQRLDAVEKDLRLKLSSVTPKFRELCAQRQAHPLY